MKKTICILLICILLSGITVFAASEPAGYTYTTESFSDEIIIPVTDTTGLWTESSAVASHDGRTHIFSNAAGDTVTFEFDKVKKGNYELYYWLMPHSKYGKKFSLEISHNGKTTERSLSAQINADETVAPGWVSLGVFDLSGSADEKLFITNPGGVLRANAVKLVPTDKAVTEEDINAGPKVELPEGLTLESFANEIVIPYTETTGRWTTSSAVPGYDGGTHLYSDKAGATLTFKIENIEPGNYEMYYWVMPHFRNFSNVDMTLHHNGKMDDFMVRQAFGDLETPAWSYLGVFDFSGDGNESAKILNRVGIIRTSAIKLVPTDKAVTEIPENAKIKDVPTDPGTPLSAYQPDAEREAFLTSVSGAPDANYTLLFEESFDTPINPDIWHYRLDERNGGKNMAMNVFTHDGRMYHNVEYKDINGVDTITGGGIISNKLFGYGYYEFKGKLTNVTGGIHSAFWLHGASASDYTKNIENLHTQELDFEFNSDRPNVACNYYCTIGTKVGFYNDILDGFNINEEHVYGLEWLPDRINYYVDGELVFSKNGKEAFLHYSQQFMWITTLAWESGDTLADKSKLPAENSFDYAKFYAKPLKDINLLGASEFEYNDNPDYATAPLPLQNPVAWGETGDIDASIVERNDEFAVGGNHVLAHRGDKDYKVTTFQKLYHIPNGLHNFEAHVMSSGGQKEAKIRLSGFDGEKIAEIGIPQTDRMTKITLDGIEVKDNQLTVEIISDAKAGQWIMLDNPSFYAIDGDVVDKHRPYTTKYENVSLGEMYVKTIHDKGFSSTGTWNNSTLVGYLNTNTSYSYEEDGPASAKFEIDVPKDGLFNICFYKLIHENTGKNCHVFYTVNGANKKETGIDLTTGETGWEVLGTESLKKGDKVTVQIDKDYGGLLRASSAAITSTEMMPVEDVLILELGDRYVWTFGEKLSVDANNPDVRPKTVNDRTMVPIRFIAEALGATVTYVEETRGIVIELNGNRIIMNVGSNIMAVNGVQKSLDTPPFVENGRTLVPVRAISEGLGKTVTWIPDRFVVIGDKAYPSDEEMFKQIEQFDKQ